ncbi:glutamate ABC transporter substrate-binding protein [Actinomadura litoris]|uniref:glutamate ABC transporter substrate-binding protein n=1 Tax=Actinomadura litoris TaxID=2678616 RepID=UPI001FA7E2AA|nr:glutamate ABC transporter substrate-binding protein [Actinomadura litoris]
MGAARSARSARSRAVRAGSARSVRRRGAPAGGGAGAVLAAGALLAAGACGVADAGENSVATKDSLVVGVNSDQPGVGQRVGNGHQGFDIDVAKEVARRLGVPPENLTFKQVGYATRDSMLRSGKVDLVVASYSITPERKTRVTFAGPYYVAHQDILVPASDTSVKDVHALKGKRLCKVPGSVSFPRVHDEKGVAALPVEAGGYAACVAEMSVGRMDAVSTDDLILAGLAAQAAKDGRGRPPRFVNAPFSDEPYGIGIRKGDLDGCEAVNKAITEMYQGRTMRDLLAKWFGDTSLKVTTTVPQFEGCD